MVCAHFALLYRRNEGQSLLFAQLVTAAISTMPAADKDAVYAAELELNSWRGYMHSYPGDTIGIHVRCGGLLPELQLAFNSVGFSQFAYSTMMAHLQGTLPLSDWGSLVKVSTNMPASSSCCGPYTERER
jgi:hypothetical protein